MKIPIENIYYLLCYAWNNLQERDKVKVEVESSATPLELLTRILISASKVLLKRGLDHNYKDISGEVNGIKGKLLFSETVKKNLMLHQRTACVYDEFSVDTLPNRIWITTLHQLTKVDKLNNKLKREILCLIHMLPPVTLLRISTSHFEQVRLNRNNRLYGFLLNVCRLLHENLLATEKEGVFRFVDFTQDERKMALVFEAFVRNFYQIEQKSYSVSRERLRWHFTTPDSSHQLYLPKMITDITLENESEKIIIDTKYYKQTLQTHYDAEKIHSSNLFQLFSYLMNPRDNTEKAHKATGILLYPTIDKEYNLTYHYQNHSIYIKTVNLNAHWTEIAARLQNIIGV